MARSASARVSIGDLLDAALATQPIDPVVTAPDRRRAFTVIEGGKEQRPPTRAASTTDFLDQKRMLYCTSPSLLS
jgi:hypothetical protein